MHRLLMVIVRDCVLRVSLARRHGVQWPPCDRRNLSRRAGLRKVAFLLKLMGLEPVMLTAADTKERPSLPDLPRSAYAFSRFEHYKDVCGYSPPRPWYRPNISVAVISASAKPACQPWISTSFVDVTQPYVYPSH
jgi:hypothetical protein